MQVPLTITYRDDVTPDKWMEAAIRDRMDHLESHFPALVSCHIAVERPHRSQRTGKLYRIRLDMSVPGKELVAGRFPEDNEAHTDFYVALRDTFRSAHRELERWASQHRRLKVKRHTNGFSHGRVSQIFDGYGFVETPRGRDVYFHENSVADGIDSLEVGTRVRFREELGRNGPQATVVKA